MRRVAPSLRNWHRIFFHGSITFEPGSKCGNIGPYLNAMCLFGFQLKTNLDLWIDWQEEASHTLITVLCDQEDETVQHILTICVFA